MTEPRLGYLRITRRDALRMMGIASVGGVVAAACGGASTPAGAGASAAPAGAFDLDALIAAAKKEGSVSYYSTGAQDAATGLSSAFTAKYGIKVELFRIGDTQMEQRIRSEVSANKLGADVIDIGNTLVPGLQALGIMEPWDPPSRAKIPDFYKNASWTEFRLYAGAIAWNTNKIKSADAPKTWKDLADPKWKGRLGLIDPAQNNTGVTWAYMTTRMYGDGHLAAVGLNKPKIYTSGTLVAPAIIAGEIDLGHVYDYSIPSNKALNAPYDGLIPEETYVGGQMMALTKSATNKNAGKLLYYFATSPEGNAAYCNPIKTIPTNPDANTAGANKVSDVKKPYAYDLADLTAKTPALIDAFKKAMQ